MVTKLSNGTTRRYKEPKVSSSHDMRAPCERDVDRVLYSREFLRLAEVTQVVSPVAALQDHNRLSHSLKVAHIGRAIFGIVKKDLGLSPSQRFAVECGCLAHDLGHPPFGHAGETALDECVKGEGTEDGFEGNAQSFRIVNVLSEKSYSHSGLNLTRESLGSILKYPQVWRHGVKKFGVYECDVDFFDWVFQVEAKEKTHCADIMDWADDLTYAVHDFTDFVALGCVPLRAILESDLKLDRVPGGDSLSEQEKAQVQTSLDLLGTLLTPQYKSGLSVNHLALRVLESSLINYFLGTISVSDGKIVSSDSDGLQGLKLLHMQFVIKNPTLARQQLLETLVVKELFRFFLEEFDNIFRAVKDQKLQVLSSRQTADYESGKASKARLTCDLVCRLSDPAAHALFQKISRIGKAIPAERLFEDVKF